MTQDPCDDPSLETRIVELEIKISYQDKLLEDLNQSIIDQDKEIQQLRKLLQQLTDSLRDPSTPPHNA